MAKYRKVHAQVVTDLRQAPGNGESPPLVPTPPPPAALIDDAPEVSYRDLQARAKELDIPANQSREDLEAAIAEAEA